MKENSPTLSMLAARLSERGGLPQLSIERQQMMPIFRSVSEMHNAGVKVRTGPRPTDVVPLSVPRLDGPAAIDWVLYDPIENHSRQIKIKPLGVGGKFDCRAMDYKNGQGILGLRTIIGTQEFKHFTTSAETIEWLVAKMANCVVEAPYLAESEITSLNPA